LRVVSPSRMFLALRTAAALTGFPAAFGTEDVDDGLLVNMCRRRDDPVVPRIINGVNHARGPVIAQVFELASGRRESPGSQLRRTEKIGARVAAITGSLNSGKTPHEVDGVANRDGPLTAGRPRTIHRPADVARHQHLPLVLALLEGERIVRPE